VPRAVKSISKGNHVGNGGALSNSTWGGNIMKQQKRCNILVLKRKDTGSSQPKGGGDLKDTSACGKAKEEGRGGLWGYIQRGGLLHEEIREVLFHSFSRVILFIVAHTRKKGQPEILCTISKIMTFCLSRHPRKGVALGPQWCQGPKAKDTVTLGTAKKPFQFHEKGIGAWDQTFFGLLSTITR